MSHTPLPAALARLSRIAALRRDRELARLSDVARAQTRIRTALDRLEPVPLVLSPEPALVAASLAHQRWIDAQRRRLLQQLAAVSADVERQRLPARLAFGRAQVVEALHQQARTGARKQD
ncbi:MAG: hypothetical protein R3D60_10950 [Paracoccaceae bacterium]